MKDDRAAIADELAELSIEEDEAQVYLALLETGTSKARTVAEEADIHRTTAYRILKDMADRGLVEVGVGRPMEFTPAPPERLFTEIRREKSRELERVDDVENRTLPTLESLQGDTPVAEESGRWRMIQGRENIVAEAVEVLEGAEEELRYLATDPIRTKEREDVDVDWESALADRAPHIDARVLVNPDPVTDEVLQAFSELKGVELRFTRSEARAQSALIDGEVFVWVVVGDEPEDDVALWSNASDLYTSQRLLFDGLWDGAEKPKL